MRAGILSATTPTISGRPEVGTTVSAGTDGWTPGTSFGYQWLRDGVPIGGATGSIHLIDDSDVGTAVSVRVTGTLAGYASQSRVSAAIGPVTATPAPPAPTEPTPTEATPAEPEPVEPGVPATDTPTIWGLPHVRATLEVDPGEWPSGTAFSYQWMRSDAAIPGATGRTYVTTTADQDLEVSVQVIGTRDGYAPESRTSSALSIYQPGVLKVTFSGARCTSTPELWMEGVRPGAVVKWSTGQRTVLPGNPYSPQTVFLDEGTIPSGDLVLTVTGQVSHFQVAGCPMVVNSWDNDLKLTTLSGSLSLAEAVPTRLPSTVTSLANAFDHNTTFNQNINSWDTSNVTSLYDTFLGAASFNQPLSSWNTSRVTDMRRTFADAEAFNQPIGAWDTSEVTTMSSMFVNAKAFNQPIGSWDTARVTDMVAMFWRASSFNQPLAGWNTSAVTTMHSMFMQATAFNQPIGTWDTSKVVDLGGAFMLASAFNQPIEGWQTSSVTNLNSTFSGAASFNQPIDGWDTANVTNMTGTFKDAASFNQPIGAWDTTSVRRMSLMFDGASTFNQPIGAWDTSHVYYMDWMFRGAVAFDQDLDCWDVRQMLEPTDFRTGSPTGWLSPKWGQPPSCG